jgi:hypothetical protein
LGVSIFSILACLGFIESQEVKPRQIFYEERKGKGQKEGNVISVQCVTRLEPMFS